MIAKRFGLLAVPALALSGAAQAAVDTSAITAGATDIGLVGVAVFAVLVGIKVIKWLRKAL